MKEEVAEPETVRVVPTLKAPVEVPAVTVAFSPVKFCRVDEPFERRLEAVTRPVEVRLPVLALWAKNRVVEAVPDE